MFLEIGVVVFSRLRQFLIDAISQPRRINGMIGRIDCASGEIQRRKPAADPQFETTDAEEVAIKLGVVVSG